MGACEMNKEHLKNEFRPFTDLIIRVNGNVMLFTGHLP